MSRKRNSTPPIYKVFFVYINATILSAPVTGFPIQKGFVIFCMTGIKKLVDGEKTRPTNAEDIRLADEEEIKLANVEASIATKTLADVKDLIVIYYIYQYWYK